MIRWSEIMEENKEQLIEVLEKSFKEAVDLSAHGRVQPDPLHFLLIHGTEKVQ